MNIAVLSFAAGMETRAKWDESKKVYKLSGEYAEAAFEYLAKMQSCLGSKTWISNSPVADVFIIWARSDRHNNKVKVWRLFVCFSCDDRLGIYT